MNRRICKRKSPVSCTRGSYLSLYKLQCRCNDRISNNKATIRSILASSPVEGLIFAHFNITTAFTSEQYISSCPFYAEQMPLFNGYLIHPESQSASWDTICRAPGQPCIFLTKGSLHTLHTTATQTARLETYSFPRTLNKAPYWLQSNQLLSVISPHARVINEFHTVVKKPQFLGTK